MKVSDLRNAFEAGRPLVQQWLDVAVQMAALRDDCREKEIDWSQVKSLLKAQILDSETGDTKRVDAILSKADNATSYAEMLGLGIPEKNISRDAPQQAPVAAETPVQPLAAFPGSRTVTTPNPLPASNSCEMPDLPNYLDRRVS